MKGSGVYTLTLLGCIGIFLASSIYCYWTIRFPVETVEVMNKVNQLARPGFDYTELFDSIRKAFDKNYLIRLTKVRRDIFSPIKEEVEKPVEEDYLADTDNDGIPDVWERKYGLDPYNPQDALEDMDNDGYSNLQEYRAGTDPTDPNSSPGFRNIKERLRVSKIYRKPIQLLFKGYMQLPDKSYVLTINWGGKTDFKKIGEEIRGYKIVDFKKRLLEKHKPWGGTEWEDVSIMKLRRKNGEEFELQIGKLVLEKEIYADLWDRKEMCTYEVHVGSEVLNYKILDISPRGIVLLSSKKERIMLERE